MQRMCPTSCTISFQPPRPNFYTEHDSWNAREIWLKLWRHFVASHTLDSKHLSSDTTESDRGQNKKILSIKNKEFSILKQVYSLILSIRSYVSPTATTNIWFLLKLSVNFSNILFQAGSHGGSVKELQPSLAERLYSTAVSSRGPAEQVTFPWRTGCDMLQLMFI